MNAALTAAQPKADGALASRLEATHGWCIAQYAASLQRLRPTVGASVLPVAGGLAIYTGPSPFSFTVGIGMGGPVSTDELDRIEQFFQSRQHAVRIDVTPFTHPSLLQMLRDRGYRRSEFTSVLVFDLAGELSSTPPPANCAIRWAEANECDAWIDVVSHCFFVANPGPERRANMAALFHVPGSLNTFATVNDALVGVAGGMTHPDGEIIALFGSATLPQFRRRGIHRAMLDFRLSHARARGCKLALITATPGSTSERNLMRHGFVECYEKVTYAK
jgi:GNAT superfamily N-acetyltransferase